ncbi:MAG: hypothetical protein ACXAD7_11220 [Candidatus Kariarchaeaceae archaeon]|jgi:hypothetical protein
MTSSNTSTKESIDRLTDTENIVKILNWEQWDMLQKFSPITSALKKAPMTVKEISSLYPEVKSLKTIYRYIDRLQESDIIKVLGYRETDGSRNPERLYGRNAKIFFVESLDSKEDATKDWKEHKGMPFVKNVANVVGSALGIPINENKIQELHNVLQDYIYTEHRELIQLVSNIDSNERLLEIYDSIPLDNINTVNEYSLLIITFLKHPRFFEAFKTIFLDG